MNTVIRNSILTVAILCLAGGIAWCQSGIYMTAGDYKHGKLSHEGSKVRLHAFFYNAQKITIVGHGEKMIMQKDTVYGYRDEKKNDYRFYKNVAYRIAEAGNLYIYVLQQNVTQDKGFYVVNRYYFSTSPMGDIWPLTLGNLKEAYKNNNKLPDLLDMYFGDGNVAAYDGIHRMYKVNYVYGKTLNSK